MRTQSFDISQLDVRTASFKDDFSFSVVSKESFKGTIRYDRSMLLEDVKVKESSFTIEALPAGTKGVNCYGKHPFLKPKRCEGEITIY